jgi:hypothetical protein
MNGAEHVDAHRGGVAGGKQQVIWHETLAPIVTVYDRWGFGQKASRSRGITALFVGASGTGKTIAAEVLANQLELDIICVDGARCRSKWIGETEKNLRRVDATDGGGAQSRGRRRSYQCGSRAGRDSLGAAQTGTVRNSGPARARPGGEGGSVKMRLTVDRIAVHVVLIGVRERHPFRCRASGRSRAAAGRSRSFPVRLWSDACRTAHARFAIGPDSARQGLAATLSAALIDCIGKHL